MINIYRGFNAITLKEFTIVQRDPMTLFFMLFPPQVEMWVPFAPTAFPSAGRNQAKVR
jgi:hypothetical protein